MINCIAIDDEPAALEQISRYLKLVPDIALIGTTTRPVEGLEMAGELKVHAIFLDMEMDEMTGVEVMRRLDPSIKVIVCTAYTEFAIESIELNAVDYLLKPVQFDRFEKAVEKLKERVLHRTLELPVVKNDYIFVQVEHKGKLKKIDFSDIIYIAARGNDVVFHAHDEFVVSAMRMDDIEPELRVTDGFIRIHRSYIVSIKMIDVIDEGLVKLKNKKALKIGRTYKDYVLKTLYPH
ncbi:MULTISPECIES: LytR/AlgR family response regulator transcription factor [Olivibacter]|jgi:DNA-binding LytR/AlgR family response regulator|uniref:LytR/AlgR family response regulator transcription factor n=1 Tax=Olivibacter oleidegradans TaxID=760123 RepID=A0ABV6HIZ5_9SPHI|nr:MULTISPECIES: LytTR family DNA-binding domain-containing protein [Olivibacter]MDM8175961.1 LytTR family DNA-binding domain-containing protein [Olivibacter sp. 47]